jgi:nucleolin
LESRSYFTDPFRQLYRDVRAFFTPPPIDGTNIVGLFRYCLRSAAVRLFSSRSTPFVIKPRSIASITSFPLRLNSQLPRFALQRRWNSDKFTRGVPESETIATVDESEARIVDFAVEAAEKERAKDGEQLVDEDTDYASSAKDDEAYRPKSTLRSPDPKETIYVGNLFYDVTADDLKQQLQKYGTVQSACIIHDNRGLSKG